MTKIISSKPDFDSKKILVIRTDRLGDFIALTPSIKALVEAYPHAQFDILGSSLNKDVLKYYERINHIYVYDKKRFLQFIPEFLKLYNQKYDVIFNYTSSSKTADFICKYIPAKVKIACSGVKRGTEDIYNYQLKYNTNPHFVLTNIERMESMGIEVKNCNYFLPVPEDIKKQVSKQYPKQKKYRLAIFIGNNKKVEHLYPIQKYKFIIQNLQKYSDLEIFIVYGKTEISLLEGLKDLPSNSYNLFFGNDLHKSAAFFASCDLLLATSTGPAHLANAANCPVYSILSEYQEQAWRPLGEKDFYILPNTKEDDIRSADENIILNNIVKYFYGAKCA